ncbi:MAG: hypothetical protein WCO56_11125 [Verrucomicrobiota bacterium]
MKKQKWYPTRAGDQVLWLDNFGPKYAIRGPQVGMLQANVDATVAGVRYLSHAISAWLPAVRAFGHSGTETLDLLANGSGPSALVLPVFTPPALPNGVVPVPPGVLVRLFAEVAEFKTKPGYTEAIGKDLGIVAAEDTSVHAAPTIHLETQAGQTCQLVKVVFVKYGHMGVYIESRRNNGAWEFLAIDTHSPYLDERPLLVASAAETREYRVRFWDKGEPTGDWSDVAKIAISA